MADLKPITRQEKIIAGEDIKPVTRLEHFLKQYGGGSGSTNKPKYSKGLEFADYGDGTGGVIGIGTCTDTEIYIPKTTPDGSKVIYVVKESFEENTNITSVVIPDGITLIGNNAFVDCINLVNVTIPNSVTEIEESAFYGCTSLTTVYYTGTEEEWANISIRSNNDPLNNATKVYNYTYDEPVDDSDSPSGGGASLYEHRIRTDGLASSQFPDTQGKNIQVTGYLSIITASAEAITTIDGLLDIIGQGTIGIPYGGWGQWYDNNTNTMHYYAATCATIKNYIEPPPFNINHKDIVVSITGHAENGVLMVIDHKLDGLSFYDQVRQIC